MIVRGISLEDAQACAEGIGVRFVGTDTSGPRKGPEVSGVLRPAYGRPNPYQRVSASAFHDRRVAAICWHGHRDWMRAVFSVNPDATIRTGLIGGIVYRGAEEFEETYRDTGYRNVGSQLYPRWMCEVCTCPDSGRAN